LTKEEQVQLVESILDRAQCDDLRHRLEAHERGDLGQSVGESWMVHHLKLLLDSMKGD